MGRKPKRVIKKLGSYFGKISIFSWAEKDRGGLTIEIEDRVTPHSRANIASKDLRDDLKREMEEKDD